jgi:two-component system nitrogen regulation sensor histidine kinase NtrY
MKSQRQTLKISMISSFLALTLLVTFAAVWIGSLLSREISVPLQMLLEGTQALSRGDLQHSVPYEAKDEIGIVVQSFNRMTGELAASKSALERSNQELLEITRSSEKRRRYIETLLETLNIGVISMDEEGDIRTFNPRAMEILGLEPGDSPKTVTSRPEWAPISPLLSSLPSRPVLNREVALSGKQGQTILSVSATPLRGPDGALFGTLVIIEDISNLSRAQRIAAWQEAAQRMAHEIKNPLTPIRLSAQRIRKKVREKAQDLDHAVVEGCTTIEREVETMMTMVNEFSRFARLPAIHPKPSSLHALLESTVATYRTVYPAVEFDLQAPTDFPPVRMDAEQMGRVFKNLFDNAVHVMEMSGKITLRLKAEEGQAVVTVWDTGPGIAPEARQRMFLPYFSTKRKGTGLGLAIVARILEEHGGAIRVDEEYSGGAGFIITLPL